MFKDITFYFIRHGQTQWNKLDLFQGASDSALTERGVEQAKRTGQKLHSIEFKAAYSSYQNRAADTAKYIIQQRDIPLFFHQGLVEIGFGKWEGQFVPNYYKHPDFINLNSDAKNYLAQDNGGEIFESVFIRSYEAIENIIKIHHSGNLLVVSHGSVLRQLIYVLSGGKWQDHLKNTEKLANTSISTVRYQQKNQHEIGQFQIKMINDTGHLT